MHSVQQKNMIIYVTHEHNELTSSHVVFSSIAGEVCRSNVLNVDSSRFSCYKYTSPLNSQILQTTCTTIIIIIIIIIINMKPVNKQTCTAIRRSSQTATTRNLFSFFLQPFFLSVFGFLH